MPLRTVIESDIARNTGNSKTLWYKTTTFFKDLSFSTACESPLCVSVAVFVIVGIVLLLMRPPMMTRRCQKTGQEYVSKISVILFSVLSGLGVFLVCFFCSNNNGGQR